jgi:hypothetical protein
VFDWHLSRKAAQLATQPATQRRNDADDDVEQKLQMNPSKGCQKKYILSRLVQLVIHPYKSIIIKADVYLDTPDAPVGVGADVAVAALLSAGDKNVNGSPCLLWLWSPRPGIMYLYRPASKRITKQEATHMIRSASCASTLEREFPFPFSHLPFVPLPLHITVWKAFS